MSKKRRNLSPASGGTSWHCERASARSRGPNGLRTTGNNQAEEELIHGEMGFRVIGSEMGNKPVLMHKTAQMRISPELDGSASLPFYFRECLGKC